MTQQTDHLLVPRYSLLNMMSVGVSLLCGGAFYLLIVTCYDAYTLGLFNLIYSVHIIAAQIGCAGVQMSVVYHVPKILPDRHEAASALSAACTVVLIMATLVSSVVYCAREWFALLFHNHDVAVGISYSIVGLWCLMGNKVLLNAVNGLNNMKAYAGITMLRYVLMMVISIAMMWCRLPGIMIVAAVSIVEAVLFIVLCVYVQAHLPFLGVRIRMQWIQRHSIYSIKGALSLMLAEANTRVDIIMLGMFFEEKVVGVYSFAALIVESVLQFPGVLRTNFSTVITRLLAQGRTDEVRALFRTWVPRLWWGMMGICVVCILLYPVLVLLLQHQEYQAGWGVLGMLLTGALVCGVYAPFSGILMQGGFPGFQSLHMGMVMLSNIILNVLLIPLCGLYGAAGATALAFILSVIYLKIMARRIVRVSL